MDYRSAITRANALIASAHAVDATGSNLWSVDDRLTITESAFLKIFIAWESFLERSFVLFMMGTPSASGNAVVRYVFPTSEDHANKILIGTLRYVDWSQPENVRKLARLFFDNGEPFNTTIAEVQSDLFDLKTIRNAAAHLSSTTTESLDRMSTGKLHRPCSGMTVYNLILAPDPGLGAGSTILQTYLSTLDAAAHKIAHA